LLTSELALKLNLTIISSTKMKFQFSHITLVLFLFSHNPLVAQVDLLTNGDFNTLGASPGTAANWTVGAGASGKIVSASYSTARGGTILPAPSGQPTLGQMMLLDGGNGFARQNVDFPAEGDYRISFNITSLTGELTPESQPAKYIQAYTIRLRRPGNLTPEVVGTGSAYTYQPWLPISFSFRTTSGPAEFSIETDQIGGYAVIDNLKLTLDQQATIPDVLGKGAAAYEIRSIPPLLPAPAGYSSNQVKMVATGINQQGDACGTAHYRSLDLNSAVETTRAFHYHFAMGTVTPLPGLTGIQTAANDINDAGDIVGYETFTTSEQTPLLWRNNIPSVLATPGGQCIATHINNTGDIIGTFQALDLELLWETGSGVFWHASGDLRTATYQLIPAGGYSTFWALSDSHHLYGIGWFKQGGLAFGYNSGNPDSTGPGLFSYTFDGVGAATLQDPPRPSNQELANVFPFPTPSINASNVVLGYGSSDTWDSRAWTWQNGTYTYLPSLVPGDSRLTAGRAINTAGTIVGESLGEMVLWKTGSIIRLKKRILNPEGIQFTQALKINDKGVIIARKNPAQTLVGSQEYYLLVPTTVAKMTETAGVKKLVFPTETGTSYDILKSADLINWLPQSNVIGTGIEAQVAVPITQPKLFFKVGTRL
jgi:uncharacterized membrane protein